MVLPFQTCSKRKKVLLSHLNLNILQFFLLIEILDKLKYFYLHLKYFYLDLKYSQKQYHIKNSATQTKGEFLSNTTFLKFTSEELIPTLKNNNLL